jgi:two-component system, chemotaxis family, CheB/CheR fusion protein
MALDDGEPMARTEEDPEFEALLNFLKEQRGFDFTGYKRASLVRRVRRQMDTLGIGSYADYYDYLELHPDEFTALFNTVLINVTSFFRDPEAWAYLSESILPALVERRPDQPIRLWSAGCASGQEAYSLAMAMAEILGLEGFRERVKIYATDVDEDALTQARHAAFTDRELDGVPSEFIDKYFEQSNHRKVFRGELRRSVIFGRNDLVQDAPISHCDLLVCRNTLMYFNAQTQAGILDRLHFALQPDGVLFLGKAEMLLSHANLFEPIELKRRFFRRAPGSVRQLKFLEVGNGATNVAAEEDSVWSRLRAQALMSSPVALLVLDPSGLLISCSRRAETTFGLGPREIGRPFHELEISYRPLELRSLVDQVREGRRAVWVRDVEWSRPEQEQRVFDVQVVPLTDEAGDLLGTTVTFHDVTRARKLQAELEYTNRQLEAAYEEVQSTNEELETTNEELQSTVEELETTNEELQSTNEELETMNEELQSMNDELQAGNDELRLRQQQIGELSGFMESVLESLRAGVAVVDRDLQIIAWNARSEDLWGVRRDEAVGEHLLNLDIGLPVAELRPVLRRVIGGERGSFESIQIAAVNRRGKSVKLHVMCSPLVRHADGVSGAIMVVDLAGE